MRAVDAVAWPARKVGYDVGWAAAGEVWLPSAECGVEYAPSGYAWRWCGLEARYALGEEPAGLVFP